MRATPNDTRPEKRPLRIFGLDPMVGRAGDYRITVAIPYRELTLTDAHQHRRDDPDNERTTFFDERLQVIDYEAISGRLLRVVDLDHPHVALQHGLEPSESDPQFHQQMVYAVASRVLENFDRALGRRVRFSNGKRLRLIPHAFRGRNAYYDHKLNAVLFGFFEADEDDPGENLAGQLVFTCLSHDIIAHEVTHALLHRLRPQYQQPTNPHVPALHEAFADVVALLQRITFPELAKDLVRRNRGDLSRPHPLLTIGAQFGAAAGLGTPLRSALDSKGLRSFATEREPHALGRWLLSAVYEGFVRSYEERSADLIRIATGGSGRLPDGELHPDLVNRLAQVCTRTAQVVLTMCIRATDYLPPVDPTFSDFLRAMVTADYELNRADEGGIRAAMIEAFRVRGIRPDAESLAVDSVLLQPEPKGAPDPDLAGIVADLIRWNTLRMSREVAEDGQPEASSPTVPEAAPIQQWASEMLEEASDAEAFIDPEPVRREVAKRLTSWLDQRRHTLGLDGTERLTLEGFHPAQRVSPSGEIVSEMVVQVVQKRAVPDDLGGVGYTAGMTLVCGLDGRVRYRIHKPFTDARFSQLKAWVAAFDEDSGAHWRSERDPRRLVQAFTLRAMDQRRFR